MNDVRGFALLALTMVLCACGARGAAEGSWTLSLEGLSLELPPSWHGFSADIGGGRPNPILWAANVPLDEDALGAWPIETLEQLPPDGIVVAVAAARQLPEDCEPPLERPLRFADEDFLGEPYESQPAPDVSHAIFMGRLEGYSVGAQAWFGREEPTAAMRRQADSVVGSVELRPFGPPGSRPYRDREARLAVRVPDNWCVARRPLMPLLTEPHELLSLGTSAAALRQGDGSCPHVPEAAVKALGPQGALISLLEYESDARPPARTKNLLPPKGARVGASCSRLQRPAGFTFSAQSFRDQDRAFQLYVAIGEAATDQTRREAVEILDSLTFDP